MEKHRLANGDTFVAITRLVGEDAMIVLSTSPSSAPEETDVQLDPKAARLLREWIDTFLAVADPDPDPFEGRETA